MATNKSFATEAAASNSWDAQGTVFVLKNRLDFSISPVVTNGDTVQALGIPAGVGVLNVFVKIVTKVGSTCTATVGDGANPDHWDASVNLDAANGTITSGIVATDDYCIANLGKIYTAADTIDLVVANAASTGIIDVYALCYQLK